jgi:hypothetical protein
VPPAETMLVSSHDLAMLHELLLEGDLLEAHSIEKPLRHKTE